MPTVARGSFEVKLTPEPTDEAGLGRMILDKQFMGDFEATSRGQMISAMSNVKGSAGYVAIERVSGTLHRKTGSFVLQHSGTMNRGVAELSVTVIPDSGTGELEGIAGRMTINREDGKHLYELEYTIGEAG